jgi:hypothetical protein
MADTENSRGCTETACKGMYMNIGGDSITDRGKCLYCGLIIERLRKGKLFCNPRCRNAFHNKRKLKGHLDTFIIELNDLLIRYGYINGKRSTE